MLRTIRKSVVSFFEDVPGMKRGKQIISEWRAALSTESESGNEVAK